MRLMRDYSKFCNHPEWYTKDEETRLYVPTAEAPEEIRTAIMSHDVIFLGATKETIDRLFAKTN